MVIEAQGTNEEIILNSWVISNKSGGSGGSGPPGKFIEAFGGSSGSGPLGKKAEVAALVGSNSLSKLKSFLENNEDLVVEVENRWLEVESINYFADPDQLEIILESATIKLMATALGGVAGGGPPGKRETTNNSFDVGVGGSTPTFSDIDDGATGGGGTIGDVAGTIIGTGSGGTLSACGISGESGVISSEIGGSGVGGSGWKKDGGSIGGSTAEADGIAVGGGSPYH